MKVIALIHAHQHVDLLNRIIEHLISPRIAIYVNLDRRSSINPADIHPSANLVRNRIDVHWGHFSQVQAILNSLQEIVAHEKDFSHLTIVSGQDYPLMTADQIVAYLAQHRGKQFLAHGLIEDGTFFAERYQYPHCVVGSRLDKLLAKWRRSAMKRLRLRRRMVNGWTPYNGSSWFTLTQACIEHVLEKATDRAFLALMRDSRCADEIFFQTIVCNSGFKASVVNNNLRYIDWSDCEKGLNESPNLLTERDFERIAASGMMFCRKMDPTDSAGLMDLLDKQLSSRSTAHVPHGVRPPARELGAHAHSA